MNNRHLDLIRDYLDDQISAEDLAQLDQLLETDAEARARFHSMATLEEGLRDLAAIPEEARTPSLPSRRTFAAWAGPTVAAAAVLVVGVIVAQYFHRESGGDKQVARLKVARVGNLEGRAWFDGSELAEGSEVSRGVVRVESGTMVLRFENGARMLLEGSVELSIDSGRQVSLKHGKVAARVPEGAYGFTVLGPDSAVVDLGTEFAMAVEGGTSWVEVYEGQVDVALLDEHGHAWKNRLVSATDHVRVSGETGQISDEDPPVPLPRFTEFSLEGLKVPAAYVDTVLKRKPAHYWRFEESNDGQVADSAGGAVAVLEHDAQIQNGGLYLPPLDESLRSVDRVHSFVTISEPSSSLVSDEFTLEAWVKPAFCQRRSLITFLLDAPPSPSQRSLYSLALMSSQEKGIYPRETFRFTTDLWPHGEKGWLNAFSADRYRPGSWHHLVGVRRRDRIEIYVNGKSVKGVTAPPIASDSRSLAIAIGAGQRSSRDRRDRRYFKGMVDEVAVYPAALSAEEVAEHFRAMENP